MKHITLALILFSSLAFGAANNHEELKGKFTYRSFINDPDVNTPFGNLEFGAGVLTIEEVKEGKMTATLDFGDQYQMRLTGTVSATEPPYLNLHGVGITSATSDWIYDYEGHLTVKWPNGVNQRPAIVGSVIRSAQHGSAQPGFVASFVAVKQ